MERDFNLWQSVNGGVQGLYEDTVSVQRQKSLDRKLREEWKMGNGRWDSTERKMENGEEIVCVGILRKVCYTQNEIDDTILKP